MEIDCEKYPFAYFPKGLILKGIGAKGGFAKYHLEFQANLDGVGFFELEMLPRIDIEFIGDWGAVELGIRIFFSETSYL
jgi:hypothetical protein